MFFKEYLQKLNGLQTFQLYTLVATFILFPYFKLIDSNEVANNINENTIHIKQDLIKLNTLLKTPDFTNVIKEFEAEAKEFSSLTITNFKIEKKSIIVSGIANQNELLKYILYCENYSYTSILKSLSIKEQKESSFINFSFTINFRKKLSDKFTSKEISTLFNSDSKSDKIFNLQAIIGDQVVINNSPLVLGEIYNGFKLVNISSDSIQLQKDNKLKTLYLNKEDTNVK